MADVVDQIDFSTKTSAHAEKARIDEKNRLKRALPYKMNRIAFAVLPLVSD